MLNSDIVRHIMEINEQRPINDSGAMEAALAGNTRERFRAGGYISLSGL